jgi:hypothetical protein
LVAGAIGAGIWAVIAYFTGFELGWIAWGVGLLVGVGVAIGNKGEGSVPAGVLAAVLAILSVVGGKYAMVRMVIPDEGELVASTIAALEDEELVVSYVADGVVQEFEQQGKAVNWPEGVERFQAVAEGDYPADVWAIAASRWDAMSAEEQAAYRAEIRTDIEASAAAFRDMISQAGFLGTFGLMDIIFFTLAVLTAFKIGRAGTLQREAYA